jgi:hypothetical protein
MAIALADLLDEKHVTLQLRSRKAANALREIVQLLALNGIFSTKCSRASRPTQA